MKETTSTKPWPKMSSAELARATRAFNDPNYIPSAIREPVELAKRHRKALSALRSKSDSTRRRDAAQVRITLQRKLLRRADDLATARGVNRSQVIAEGLELLLARA